MTEVVEHADRSLAHQRAQVETAKLVTTFSAGIGAALVASALQVGGVQHDTHTSVILLGAAVGLVVVVVLCDRLKVVDHDREISAALLSAGDVEPRHLEEHIVTRLQEALVGVADFNGSIVKLIRAVAAVQLLTAFATTALAARAMW